MTTGDRDEQAGSVSGSFRESSHVKSKLRIILILVAIQGAVMFSILSGSNSFEPVFDPDSYTYVNYFDTGEHGYRHIKALLSSHRTPGYPIFIKFVQTYSPQLESLPETHYVFHIVAVMFLAWCLVEYGFSPFMAFAAASPLLYAKFTTDFACHVLSDCAAVSMTLFAAGSFFMFMSGRRRILSSILLSLSVLTAILIRPAYLFLLPFFPLLAFLMNGMMGENDRQRAFKARLLASGKCLACVAVPFILWCTTRLVTVGDFGPVSFSGSNIIGISGQLVTQDMVERLSPEYRQFASSLIEARKALKIGDGFPTYRTSLYSADHGALIDNFNPVAHKAVYMALTDSARHPQNAFSPWLLRISPSGDLRDIDHVQFDRFKLAFSKEVVRIKRDDYLRIVYDSFFLGLATEIDITVAQSLKFQLVTLAGIAGFFTLGVIRANSCRARTGLRELYIMSAFAISYTLAKMLTIILVEPSIDRYVRAAVYFLQCPYFMLMLLPWCCIFGFRNHFSIAHKQST